MKVKLISLFLLLLLCFVNSSKVPSAVLELNDKFLDVKDQGFWLIKLYAPWCAHCKRLAPVWEHVGHALADKNNLIKVGKVDCTRFSNVAHKLKVSGYPTIIFFRNGIQIPYEGERSKEALVDFAIKSAGPVVQSIVSRTQFDEIRRSKDPFILYVGGDSNELWAEYEEVAGQLFTQTGFYRTDQLKHLPSDIKLDQRPTVLAVKPGYYVQYVKKEDEPLSDWIKRERWADFPLISASNIHDISENTNKKLVLSVVDPVERLDPKTETSRLQKMFEEVAVKVRKDPELNPEFQLGFLEGTDIANSVVMARLDTPNLFVLNLSSYEFYLPDDKLNESTVDSVLTFLRTIKSGHSQPLGGRSWSQRIRRMIFELVTNVSDMFYHQPILTTCLFGVPIAFFSIITYSLCSSDFSVDRDEIYPDEDDLDDEDDGKYLRNSENTDFSELEEDSDGHEKAE
ncbi:unnamed protein product [Bursaphelenchus xylophilus]|uniref:(pine wood nematode) hypothetical protein n=1 Tax=Bursaphelenchus xylophilus TaxID=6326 RepID=A0A1I7RVA1_BURXY|nr:unnamed protein product [Bursaphelenchus xylophilus]CAG9086592.1 unnamed protein product [Bursaphelenchus xylophilus]